MARVKAKLSHEGKSASGVAPLSDISYGSPKNSRKSRLIFVSRFFASQLIDYHKWSSMGCFGRYKAVKGYKIYLALIPA